MRGHTKSIGRANANLDSFGSNGTKDFIWWPIRECPSTTFFAQCKSKCFSILLQTSKAIIPYIEGIIKVEGSTASTRESEVGKKPIASPELLHACCAVSGAK